jgi:hypothetical protein
MTCENADVDRFILDERGYCSKDKQDKILFPRMRLSKNLVKLQMLK